MYISIIKPLLDKIFVLLVLPFLLPIIIFVSILIFLFDGFPIFFVQSRPGKDAKLFKLIKFRTMSFESESASISRVTKFGSFLRRLSIDELPSLLNILIGHMSLIGPRPLLTEYLKSYDDNQIKRHNVLPGLTGLAQIKGRNSITWNEKFTYDLYYVENVSFLLDIKIFFNSFLVLFNHKIINQNSESTMERFDEK